MDTDAAMVHAGGWEKYQKMLYTLICLASIPNALIVMHFVTSNYEPRHRCVLQLEVNESSELAFNNSMLNKYIPEEADENGDIQLSSCRMYGSNNSFLNSTFNSTNTTKCNHDYVYDLGKGQQTAVSEFTMVCENDWQALLSVSLYQAGNGLGSLLMVLADRFGRRPTFLISCVLHVMTACFISFSWNAYAYMAANFLCAAVGQINYVIAFVLATEMADPSWRNFMACGSMYAFAIGYCMVALFGYLLQNWRWYLIAVSITTACLYLPNFWLLPESVRWLVQRGRKAEAIELLKKIARVNGKSQEFEQAKQMLSHDLLVKEVEPVGVMTALKILARSGIGMRCAVVSYTWFVCALSYYAIGYYSTSFSEDRFLNILYAGLADIPALILGYFAIKLIGRPRSIFVLMMLTGISSIVLPFVPKDVWAARTTLSVLGKGAIAAVFYGAYLISTEIVPTLQRSSYMSFCSASSRVGSVLAPALMYIDKLHPAAPNLIMGGLAIVSALMTIVFVPETRGIKMPDTIVEAKNNKRFYRSNIFRKFNETCYRED